MCVGRPPFDLESAIAGADVGGGVSGEGCDGRDGTDRGAAAAVGVADVAGALVGVVAVVVPTADDAVGAVPRAGDGADVFRVVADGARAARGTSSEGSESSARRRSARPFRLLAASARCRSFSSLSTLSRWCCVRVAAAFRDAFCDDLCRVATASSESSAAVDMSGAGERDRELVRWRFKASAFLKQGH